MASVSALLYLILAIILTLLGYKIMAKCERSEATSESKCWVCFDSPGDHCLDPCGHAGICGICSGKVKQCPICKRTVNKTIKFFKP